MVSCAPGTAEPLGSVTRPLIDPVKSWPCNGNSPLSNSISAVAVEARFDKKATRPPTLNIELPPENSLAPRLRYSGPARQDKFFRPSSNDLKKRAKTHSVAARYRRV